MGGSNKDVIKIDQDKACGNQVFKDLINELLEHGWGVAQTKGHHIWFPMPWGMQSGSWGFECSLSLVPFFDLDIVVACSQVKGSEELSIGQSACQVFKIRKWVAVWDGIFV